MTRNLVAAAGLVAAVLFAAPILAQETDQTAQTPAATEPAQTPPADATKPVDAKPVDTKTAKPADKPADTKTKSKTAATKPADTKAAAKKDDEVAKAEDPAKRPVDGVAAIVNDSVISEYDVRQRVGLFFATSGSRPTEENKKQVREQVLKQLEAERLQLLEAQKKNVSVTSADVDAAIDDILKDNSIKKEQLEQMFGQAGVRMSTFRAQIAAQLAWAKLVGGVYGDELKIDDDAVDAEWKRIKANSNKPRYLVAEIFQAVDTPEQEDKIKKDVQGIVDQLRMGAPFAAVARQFSQAPTAGQGGDLGWIVEGDLAPALNDAVMKLHAGEVSDPIRAAGGYYILGLRARQEPAGTKIEPVKIVPTGPPGTLPLARILLPIGPSPGKDLLQNAVKAAQYLRSQIQSCNHVADIVKKLPGAVYMNLGQMRLSDLSAQIQGEVNKAGPGEVTDPFQSAAGIELIARCDKAPPKPAEAIHIPTRDEVKGQMYQEQMAVYARRYMRDLRRNANIEIPGEKDKKVSEADKPKLNVKAQ